MPDDDHRPHQPDWLADGWLGDHGPAMAGHTPEWAGSGPDPHLIDPRRDGVDDPPATHGLHIVASRVDGFIALDDYTRDVRSGDRESLMHYLATELLARNDQPARYRVSVPNDHGNWPPIEDVIVTDEPMGAEGVYIAWASDAARWGYGMHGMLSSDALDQRRRDLAARQVREQAEREARHRTERERFAAELGDLREDYAPQSWIETGAEQWEDARAQWEDTRAQERFEAAERAANRRSAELISALGALTEAVGKLTEQAAEQHGALMERIDDCADGLVDKLDEAARPIEEAVSLGVEEITDALEIVAPPRRGRQLARIREQARRAAHEAAVARHQAELARARDAARAGLTEDDPAPEGAPLDR